MRKFAFQELAYAIVVAGAYGLLIGIYITNEIDLFIRLPLYIILWVIFTCLHLAGIYLLVKLEEREIDSKKTLQPKNETE